MANHPLKIQCHMIPRCYTCPRHDLVREKAEKAEEAEMAMDQVQDAQAGVKPKHFLQIVLSGIWLVPAHERPRGKTVPFPCDFDLSRMGVGYQHTGELLILYSRSELLVIRTKIIAEYNIERLPVRQLEYQDESWIARTVDRIHR